MQRERVLVTTDLSQNSYKVIDKSMNFALEHNAWLEVLHVAEPSLFSFGFSKGGDTPVLTEDQQNKLVEFSGRIKQKMGRVIDKMNVETRLGDVSSMVDAYSKEKRVGLLIIGDSERKGGVKELVLGSTAKRIIAKSSTPVLVVKVGGDASYKNIFVPTDFSDKSLETIASLAEIAPKATITLWHTVDVPSDVQLAFYNLDDNYLVGFTAAAKAVAEEKMKKLVSSLEAKGVKNLKTEIETGQMNSEFVTKVAREKGADLIALTADSTLFSNTFAIMERSHSDVLLFKA